MATIAWRSEGLALVLIGETFGWLGCSLYLREVCGRQEGAPPPVDLATERRHGELVRALCEQGHIEACHDLSDGGLYVALAEMALASGIGADLELPEDCESRDGLAVRRGPGALSAGGRAGSARRGRGRAGRAGVLARRVGTTGGVALTLAGGDAISLQELAEIHRSWLPSLMGTT